ncbi:hypothetical protein LPU83_pLPU83d_0429 (plasmid) [Rhizobium favelukesii]|uniref:Uncharacterized protein n=1 Tax=Rhizobium favelukesii TaxID=348824 RepID=W6RNK8_9HYPH|nr:hypothetical protein LPU83_pLPU83d_0429 [Rhizobium favelukesii]
MSLPRLEHNGIFSPYDLGRLRAEIDAWCERDASDYTQIGRSCDNGTIVTNRPVLPQHMLLSFRTTSTTLARRAKRKGGAFTVRERVQGRPASIE